MFYIGIDLGGTNIAAGLVNEDGMIIYKESIPTFRHRPFEKVVEDMGNLAANVISKAGKKQEDVKYAGIGSPGITNKEAGQLVYACNFNFKNFPVASEIQKYIKLPVYIDNDANCAALAEGVAGAAKGSKHSVTITLGTGIGGGVIIDGKIYSGFNYAASELGHMIISIDGEQCTCGRKGCWEAYASATALIKQTRAAAEKNPNSLINRLVNHELSSINAKTAFDAAKLGDETAVSVVEQYIRYLAEGIINTINIFQPEIIVIGGGVSKEGENLLKPLRKAVSEGVYSRDIPQTQIKVAELGNDAGIIGAAMLGK